MIFFDSLIERSPCQSDTCQNGGTCFETESGFKCLCQMGYEGKTCSGKNQHLLLSSQSGNCHMFSVLMLSFLVAIMLASMVVVLVFRRGDYNSRFWLLFRGS